MNAGSYDDRVAAEPRGDRRGSSVPPLGSVVHPRSAPTGCTTWGLLPGRSTPTRRWMGSPEVSSQRNIGNANRGNLRNWIFSGALPAASLLILVIWQIWWLGADSRLLGTHPTLPLAIGCLRSGLYIAFLSIPAVVLLLHDPPAASDDRLLIRALAIVTTF